MIINPKFSTNIIRQIKSLNAIIMQLQQAVGIYEANN